MKKLLVFSFVAIFLMMAAGAQGTNGGTGKWLQPPDMEYGVNIKSTESEPIVADDWKCEDPREIVDVHFWGSYIGWEIYNPEPPLPPPGVNAFIIRIYKDVPAGADPDFPYSHPGELLYEKRVTEFKERYYGTITHPDKTYEHKFYYSLDLPEPFYQREGTVYWISIAAVMPDGSEFPWGWETSTAHWNDNACRYWFYNNYWEEILPSQLPSWYQEHYRTVDMAFELTVEFEPPPPLEPIKWQQRPDMEQGVNIISIPIMPSQNPVELGTVADDWLCLDASPVSDLHFWGSYPGWLENEPDPTGDPPGVEAFRIQVYSNAPATSPQDFSRPDKLLYEVWVEDFTETYVASIFHFWDEKWEHKYRYDLDLPRIFWQKRDKIYWLNISAIPAGDYPWGWESSMDRWGDFAVKGWYLDPDNWWWEMIKHPYTGENIDMAFELTTCEGPIKWLQFPDMANGINILSLDPVVADDWLCIKGKPITEIHFWGSYLSCDGQVHWEQRNPGPPENPLPPTPGLSGFWISFHKNVPAGVDPDMPWSHPGELIKEIWVDFKDVKEIYWDSVPHSTGPDGLIWWEHKFYYIVRLEEPFKQEEGTIYWLNIGATPLPDSRWCWGWETSKDHWNDNAVQGSEEWWEDLGQIYEPPIDMAFLLITEDDTDYCEGDFDRDGDVDGSELAIFAADFGRTDCYFTGDCEGDFDYDGDVDGSDLAIFAADFGRTDCPCALNVP